MYRYVALIWNPSSDAAHDRAFTLHRALTRGARWKPVLLTPGLHVMLLQADGPTPSVYLLPNSAGVVLGQLFDARASSHEDAEARMSEYQARHMQATKGESLRDEYWGSYVAFLRAESDPSVFVMRDCSGAIPCYRTSSELVEVVMACIADIDGLPGLNFTLNRRYLASYVASPEFQIRACALNEVTEVLAGERTRILDGTANTVSLWRPAEIYERRRRFDYEEAVLALRATTERCVRTWSHMQENVLLSLSGGFDSSAVLGILAHTRSPSSIMCLNMFGSQSGEDERPFARLAARRAAVSLREHRFDSAMNVFDGRLSTPARSCKPSTLTPFAILNSATINEVATEVGADALWTGQGGDHLFWQAQTPLSAVDYVSDHGFDFTALKCIVDAAVLSNTPYATVGRMAWQLSRRNETWRPAEVYELGTHFVSPEALDQDFPDYIRSPWTVGIENLPKCKQLQVHFLTEVVHRHRPIWGVELVHERHPLISQPLMELCVQLPTYLLLRGGRDRALARHALARYVPEQIDARDDKGTMHMTITDTFRRSEHFLREMLLDGFLTRERIIDARSLEPYLCRGEPFRAEQCRPLIACITAEMWCRQWYGHGVRAIA